MNVVMLGSGNFVEVAGHAEGHASARRDGRVAGVGESGIEELIGMQRAALQV